MFARPTALLIVSALCILASAPATSYAQSALPACFGPAGPGSAAAFLGSRITPSADCEYSLTPDGRYQSVPAQSGSLLSLLSRLSWRPGQVAIVYGRPTSQAAQADAAPAPSSVMLAHCTDYMLQAQGAFAVRPDQDARQLNIRRANTACGSSAIGLRFECSAGGATRELGVSAPNVALPQCEGEWRVTAGVGDAPAAYPLGVVRAGRPTALIDFTARPQPGTTLLVPDFDRSDRGFGLRRGADAGDALWAELQVALTAGSARFVRAPADAQDACATGSALEAVPAGDRVELGAAPIAEFMRARLGPSAAFVSPGASDWEAFLRDVHLCVASSHGVHRPVSRSIPFAQIASVGLVAQATPQSRICVQEPRIAVGPRDTEELERTERCMRTGDGAAMLTVAGATLPARAPNGLLLCRGETLVRGEGDTISLERGLYELRVASPTGCQGGLGLSAGRIGVIDPAQDWIPAGFGRDDDGETQDAAPGWRGVRIDDPNTFAFRPREDELRFRVVTGDAVATSWNDARGERGTVLSDQAPLLGAETGSYGSAGATAFAVALTRDAACPVDEEGAVPAGALVSASELRVDEQVYAHLILRGGDARCVARASLRVWQPRIVAHAVGSRRWHGRLGILGAPRLGVFISSPDPVAIGVVLPIVHFDMHLPYGFDIEFSVPLTASVAFDGQASRLSPALMVGLDWGLPDRAQNLITIGALIHAPWPHDDDEFYSFFFGVNLGGIYELIGGR